MIDVGYLRGHFIVKSADSDDWYFDASHKKVDFDNEPDCIKCNQPPTAEGYDACLGYIPGALAACCGHGIENLAYIK